jgi:recombination protein RecA
MAPKTPAAAKKDPNANLPPALSAVLAQIQKEFGEGAIMRPRRRRDSPAAASSRSSARNPPARPPSPSYHRPAQKRGGLAAFIDTEHALDPGYAKKLGVNLDDLLVSQPSTPARRPCNHLRDRSSAPTPSM